MTEHLSKPPRFLMGAALVFWGWQTEFLVLGAILALLIEAAHWTPTRWDFGDDDFSKIWTFCALLLLTAAVFAFTSNDAPSDFLGFLQDPNWRTQRNAGNSSAKAVASLIRWQPIIFFPFVAAAAYSSRSGVPLHTISLILRRRWRKAQSEGAPVGESSTVNVSYPYFALTLFAASIHQSDNLSYFWGLCILVAWALWPRRSRRFALPVWAGTLGVVVGLGYFGQQGITQLQHYIGSLNPYWFIKYGKGRFESKQTRTMIGQIGRIKQSGAVLLRIETRDGIRPPSLLREASYRGYRSQVWYSAQGRTEQFENINPEHPETNATTYVLLPEKELLNAVSIACYLPGGQGLLPLPRGTARLENLPAFILQRNSLGSVMAEGPGLVIFDALHGPGPTIDASPEDREDIEDIPEREKAALDKVIEDLGLRNKSIQQASKAIQAFFGTNFTYSTWQERIQGPRGEETPLSRFLLTTRRGHCEYFATATVLLMRRLGFPARYAVGYAVHETAGKNKFVVRQRDAHAWALVYHNGTWHDLDTTPATWIPTEMDQASPFQPISDFWSRLTFEISKIRYGQTHLRTYILYALLPVLGLLAVQIFRKRRQRRSGEGALGQPREWPGADSEFYELERRLVRKGIERRSDEPLSAWLLRAADAAGLLREGRAYKDLLRLHYKYRFDPRGLAPIERKALRESAAACVSALDAAAPRINGSRHPATAARP